MEYCSSTDGHEAERKKEIKKPGFVYAIQGRAHLQWLNFFLTDQSLPLKDLTTSQQCQELGTKLLTGELRGAISDLIHNNCHQICIKDIEPVTTLSWEHTLRQQLTLCANMYKEVFI